MCVHYSVDRSVCVCHGMNKSVCATVCIDLCVCVCQSGSIQKHPHPCRAHGYDAMKEINIVCVSVYVCVSVCVTV